MITAKLLTKKIVLQANGVIDVKSGDTTENKVDGTDNPEDYH
jgi:hypothetical protein